MNKPKKRGPAPETLVLDGPWGEAVKVALAKGKPPAARKAKKKKPRSQGGAS